MDAATKLASTFVNDDMITIELENGDQFTVQKALLSNASDYFDRAVNGRFTETATKTLKLKEWTTDSIKLFLHWICRHSLPGLSSEIEKLQKATPEESSLSESMKHAAQVHLVQLWINADMCLMPALQNAAMRELLRVLSNGAPAKLAIRLAYEKSSPDSLLRALFLNEFAYCNLVLNKFGGPGHTPEDMNEIATIPGFFAALMERLQETEGNYVAELRSKTCEAEIDSTEVFEYMIPDGEEMDMSG